jgi:hypothetical protein
MIQNLIFSSWNAQELDKIVVHSETRCHLTVQK